MKRLCPSLGGRGGGGEPDLEGRPGGGAAAAAAAEEEEEEEEASSTAEAALLWEDGLGGRGGGTAL